MTKRALQLYGLLPPFARPLAATLRGLYLRRFRYSRATDELVEQALERDGWDERQWESWREERLAYVLHRAATKVPYYREQWNARRRKGDRASWEILQNWPLLDKEQIRTNPRGFIADGCNPRQMFPEHTSGTTGKPLDIWVAKDTVRRWYALFEARCRAWYGVSRHDRWAILGGQMIVPVSQRRAPFWVWNAALHQLYMSSYHLGQDLIPHYLDALSKYRVKYLCGYSSSLYELALGALRLGRRDLRMAVAITTAEPLLPHQRKTIEDAFQCHVCETYGMVEIVAAASECPYGGLHLWPEVGNIEVVDESRSTYGVGPSPLVCTGLMNADMPLIRYKMGDCGAMPVAEIRCGCGRRLPLIGPIEGRVDDVLVTVDGRRVGRLSPVFKRLPIQEAQTIQERLDLVRVRYVPTAEFTAAAGRLITERLQARLGHVQVILEPVERVPRGINGKFRTVVCNLPSDDRRHADRV